MHRLWWSRWIRTARLQAGLRFCVLVWVLLSQFPLPLVHAHADDEPDSSRLIVHLREHHTGQLHHVAPHGLHWHLIVPWDSTEGGDQARAESSPLGLWGAKVPAIPQVQAGLVCSWEAASVSAIASDAISLMALPVVATRGIDAYPCGFIQTYAGVPWCALLGVAQC